MGNKVVSEINTRWEPNQDPGPPFPSGQRLLFKDPTTTANYRAFSVEIQDPQIWRAEAAPYATVDAFKVLVRTSGDDGIGQRLHETPDDGKAIILSIARCFRDNVKNQLDDARFSGAQVTFAVQQHQGRFYYLCVGARQEPLDPARPVGPQHNIVYYTQNTMIVADLSSLSYASATTDPGLPHHQALNMNAQHQKSLVFDLYAVLVE